MRLIDADALPEHKFVGIQFKQIGGRRNGKTLAAINRAYQLGWNDSIDAIVDNVPTIERPQDKRINKIIEELESRKDYGVEYGQAMEDVIVILKAQFDMDKGEEE